MAEATGTKADYLKERGQSTEYCMALINDLLRKNGSSPRSDIDDAVTPFLPAGLDERQRANCIDYLLKKMKRDGKIVSVKVGGRRMWSLTSQA